MKYLAINWAIYSINSISSTFVTFQFYQSNNFNGKNVFFTTMYRQINITI